MPDDTFNPWKDPCIFVHAHEDTYKAICAVVNTLKEQGVEPPDVGVLLNPFGQAMIFIIDMRKADPRVEKIIINNVPTAMKPQFQNVDTEANPPEEQQSVENQPIPQPKRPSWVN